MPGTALPGFPLSPFICLPLSPSLDDPVWVDGFLLPAWMLGTALWVDGFSCLSLFSFMCLPAWMPGAARVHLSPFVSRCLPACLGGQIHFSPFLSLHLSAVVSQPGSGTALWVDGFMCLPLSPSFVSRSLPAWMPGTALWVDGFICLPLSPLISPIVSEPTGSFVSLSRCLPAWMPGCLGGRVHLSTFVSQMSGTPLFPFICLPLSPSLDAWHCFFVDRFTFLPLSPFIWLLLSLFWFPGLICFPLSPFICLPLSPSLDAWHGFLGGRIHLSPVVSQPGCVALRLRGFLHFPRFCPFGGVWFAFGFGPGFGHSLSCGCWGQGPPLSALHLDFDFAWARGRSSSLSIVGYTVSVRSVPRYQLRSRADDSGALRCAASATRRLC